METNATSKNLSQERTMKWNCMEEITITLVLGTYISRSYLWHSSWEIFICSSRATLLNVYMKHDILGTIFLARNLGNHWFSMLKCYHPNWINKLPNKLNSFPVQHINSKNKIIRLKNKKHNAQVCLLAHCLLRKLCSKSFRSNKI